MITLTPEDLKFVEEFEKKQSAELTRYRGMTIDKAKLIMQNELDCVLRNEAGKCNRDCANCDLVLPTEDVVSAYEVVIRNLEKDIYIEIIDKHLKEVEECTIGNTNTSTKHLVE